jgi:hypothetical protein
MATKRTPATRRASGQSLPVLALGRCRNHRKVRVPNGFFLPEDVEYRLPASQNTLSAAVIGCNKPVLGSISNPKYVGYSANET